MIIPKRVKNLTDMVYGRLTVVTYAGNTPEGKARWLCVCSCSGRITIVTAANLKCGHVQSCGCLLVEHAQKVAGTNIQHGECRRGLITPEYRAWQNIRERCYNVDATGYVNYGGRGISVCGGWRESFYTFLKDMGRRAKFTSIDRIDNDGDYEPSNCRWATWEQQANNKTRQRMSAK